MKDVLLFPPPTPVLVLLLTFGIGGGGGGGGDDGGGGLFLIQASESQGCAWVPLNRRGRGVRLSELVTPCQTHRAVAMFTTRSKALE